MTTTNQSFFDKESLNKLKNQTPFFVFSRQALLDNLKHYQQNLPSETEICYAMKANSERQLLQVLHQAGSSFEVASKYELALLKPLKVAPGRIMYGTAVKPISHIKAFAKYGVRRYAFDSEQELIKIAKYVPGAKVYVRTLVDDKSDSVFHMSEKFGILSDKAADLLVKAKEYGLIPYGISFNVGSQARNPKAWANGIRDVGHIMEELLESNVKIEVVNIGGGFPYTYDLEDRFPDLQEISEHIADAIKSLPYEVKFIAEPGRGISVDAFVLVIGVIEKSKRSNGNWLFVDAGVYNALLEAMAYQGQTNYRVSYLGSAVGKLEHYILTGPTGDNLDIINKDVLLPTNIKPGDRLVIHDTGAYTFTLATKFNGFPKPRII